MALTLRLAGYNLDADLIHDITDTLRSIGDDGSDLCRSDSSAADYRGFLEGQIDFIRTNLYLDSLTPETIAAAYARISRDPKPVSELRKAARLSVARARKSNENIIFGLGHSSVAEHACFNFDITGLSRFAAEELQSHRLVSFTEKSQRYISLTADFVIPAELRGSPWETRLRKAIPGLFSEYQELSDRLSAPTSEASAMAAKAVENKAIEDARYLLPLACATQMGMTVNARNIEHITRDLSDHPLSELRELGQLLRTAVGGLAPSLVKYTVRGDYPRRNREQLTLRISHKADAAEEFASRPSVRLVESTPDGERIILRALAFRCGAPWDTAMSAAAIWPEVFRSMTEHDSVLREFELAALTFEAIISASCYAQLKRHRMMTLLHQPYRPEDGMIIPPAIEAAGLGERYRGTARRHMDIARTLYVEQPDVAPYLLLNGQRRRVVIHLNVRELYHFTRLRCDSHAQWEIRMLADEMLEQTRRIWPNAAALACGKDQFADMYQRLFA